MKLLIASLTNETNTFAPFPVGRAAFENLMVTRQATREPAVAASTPLHIWREMGEAKGFRERLRDRALARGQRAVHRDDHDVSICARSIWAPRARMSSIKPG